MEKIINNPWPGLSSYEDPFVCGNKYKFCGRDSEVYDVVRLIDDNFFVTLYGKSGIGKSSLLKAGVFPYIRKDQYLPLMLRLGLVEESDCFQPILINTIEKAVKEQKGYVETIEVVKEEEDTSAVEYLWNYFARHKFYDERGNIIFPVVVLDQFEEVFRKRHLRRKAKLLLSQINYLIDENHALGDCIVNGREYYYDFNFRFVVSIREDELYRLEESLDNNYLPSLKNYRYRLKSLTEQGAKDVVSIPGEGMFKLDEESAIVDAIIDSARNETGDGYSTNVLSLVCNRIFEEASKIETWPISLAMVKEFLEGNPFERFYNEATESLPAKEKHYIEDNLIDGSGRRNAITEEDFIKNVPHGSDLLKEGPRKILQRVSVSSDAERPRIELIHDSFCAPLAELKLTRRHSKELRITAIALFSAFIVIAVAFWINARIQKSNDLLKIQSRYVAKEVQDLIEKGDFVLAAQLAIEIIPRDLSRPNRPYTTDGEVAIRNLSRHIPGFTRGWTTSKQAKPFRRIAISSDNKIVYGISFDDVLYVYQRESLKRTNNYYPQNSEKLWMSQFELKDTFDIKSSCPPTLVSNAQGVYIARTKEDNTIQILNAETRQVISSITGQNAISSLEFSSSGDELTALSANNVVCLYDVGTSGMMRADSITSLIRVKTSLYAPKGKALLVMDSGDTSYVWKIEKDGSYPLVYQREYSRELPNHVSFDNIGKVMKVSMSDGDQYQVVNSNWLYEGNDNNYSYDEKSNIHSSANGSTRVAYEKGELSILEKDFSLRKRISLHSRIEGVTVSPNGKRIAVNTGDDMLIVDTGNNYAIDTLKGAYSWRSGFFNYEGNLYLQKDSFDGFIVWDAETMTIVDTISANGGLSCYDLSHDEKMLISGWGDAQIRIYDTRDLGLIKTIKAHENGIYHISYTSENEFVTCSYDGTIKLWNALSGKLLRTESYLLPRADFHSISPDGKVFTEGVDKKYIALINTKDGDYCDIDFPNHNCDISAISFSPNGKFIISGTLRASLSMI